MHSAEESGEFTYQPDGVPPDEEDEKEQEATKTPPSSPAEQVGFIV